MQAPKPYREERPWGAFVEFTRNAPTTVKIITVHPGQALSLQKHEKREEFWHIFSGDGFVTVGDDRSAISVGKEFFIPRRTNHRIEAGNEDVVVLEISFGEFDENDIIRLEDKYGRTEIKK